MPCLSTSNCIFNRSGFARLNSFVRYSANLKMFATRRHVPQKLLSSVDRLWFLNPKWHFLPCGASPEYLLCSVPLDKTVPIKRLSPVVRAPCIVHGVTEHHRRRPLSLLWSSERLDALCFCHGWNYRLLKVITGRPMEYEQSVHGEDVCVPETRFSFQRSFMHCYFCSLCVCLQLRKRLRRDYFTPNSRIGDSRPLVS